jgi:hypothetical protein
LILAQNQNGLRVQKNPQAVLVLRLARPNLHSLRLLGKFREFPIFGEGLS